MPIDRELIEFARRYHVEVIERASGGGELTTGITSPGDFRENVFTGTVLDDLTAAGVLEDGEVCFYQGRMGPGNVKVNGYAVGEDEDRLVLFTTIYQNEGELGSIGTEAIRTAADRCGRFLKEVANGRHSDMEPSSEAYAMASRIFELRDRIEKTTVLILTDGIAALKAIPASTIGKVAVAYEVWDMERLFRSFASGRPHEVIEIDFARMGSKLPCLPVPLGESDYESYLCVIPGTVLFDIYEEYGPRLLELNVRSFLQARGKVNKGIRDTIKDDPRHFFPYNNGLSMTAAAAKIELSAEGTPEICYLRGLQIVNGGQTTASIHRAHKTDKADLSNIFVQAKLTVVDGDKLEEMVPKISKYANSQNAVSVADFSANHPYHIELERLSGSVWVPGEQSRWFYERARGQYQVAKAREAPTPAQANQFDVRTPVSQKFSKTDLAKYLNSWDGKPHLVSRGGQKNFVSFMDDIRIKGSGWLPDQQYYQDLIAQAILFKRAQKIVNEEGFEAYRPNIITYTLAYIAEATNGRVDLDEIWENQAIPATIERTIRSWSRAINDRIIAGAGTRNVTEWCKRETCWDDIRAMDMRLPAELLHHIGGIADTAGSNGMSRQDLNNIAACKRVTAEQWMRIHVWATQERRLKPVQRGIVLMLSGFAAAGWNQEPTRKQAKQAVEALAKARESFPDL